MLTTRRATAADLPALLALVGRVVPLMHASGNFQWSTDYPNAAVFSHDIECRQLWVAELGGAVAGVAALTTDQDPEYSQADWDVTEPALVTHRLAVDPATRHINENIVLRPHLGDLKGAHHKPLRTSMTTEIIFEAFGVDYKLPTPGKQTYARRRVFAAARSPDWISDVDRWHRV